MSNFAEEQMKKYGWNKGDGIGKNNQGILNPVKASFKFDTAGIGYDIADEFTTNWWEHLFNHTAKKIDPSNGLKTKEWSENNDEKKSTTFLNRKSLFYARFQKASILVDGQTVKVESEEKKEKEVEKGETYDKKGKKIVSDEILFKLCEGRTAHKGARHGIKMNGKLARLKEQEANFFKSTQLKSDSNKRTLDSEVNENEEKTTYTDDTELTNKKKKKKKKNKE